MNKLFYSLIILAIAFSIVTSFEGASDSDIFAKFQAFTLEHKKSYATVEEFQHRFLIFKQNFKQVEAHQAMMTVSEDSESYTFGVTQFSDMTPSEFERTYLTLDVNHLERQRLSLNLSFL